VAAAAAKPAPAAKPELPTEFKSVAQSLGMLRRRPAAPDSGSTDGGGNG
jgi:hypothetical protein